jgi:hypothetical protein
MKLQAHFLIFMMTVISCDAISGARAGADDDTKTVIADLRHDVALVEGRVSAIKPFDGDLAVDVSITHVFFGHDINVGDVARALAWGPDRGSDSLGKFIVPVPKVGEIGLWVINTSGNAREVLGAPKFFKFAYPARKDVAGQGQFGRNRFEDGLALAQLVERLGSADRKNQVLILTNSINSSVPVVSSWSVQSLGQLKAAELKSLARDPERMKALPKSGQMDLDTVLEGNDKDWPTSEIRYSLLLNCARESGSEYEQSCIATRLADIAYSSKQESTTIADDLHLLAVGKGVSVDARFIALTGLGYCAKNPLNDRKAIVELISDIAMHSSEKLIQDKASYEIAQMKRNETAK